MSRADTAEEAAEALGQASPSLAAVLMGAYALLAIAVTGRLAVRIGRRGDTASARLTPLLGAGHVLLMTATVAAPAAAVAVGTLVLEGGVSPTSTEAALLLMNVAHPMAAWVGAGFLIAVATGTWADSRVLADRQRRLRGRPAAPAGRLGRHLPDGLLVRRRRHLALAAPLTRATPPRS